MPNLRSQEVNEKGIRMIASDGREFYMATGQIKKQYDDTLAAKRIAIAAEMKLQAVPEPMPDRSLVILLAATILVLTVTAISAGYWPVLAVAFGASIASAFTLRRQPQTAPPLTVVTQAAPKPLPEVEAKSETTTWLKGSIVAALGPEQISLASIVADFRDADGVPTQLEIG